MDHAEHNNSWRMVLVKRLKIICPFFQKKVSYRQYQNLKKCLHFSNNGNYDPDIPFPNPKLYKIWPIYSIINELSKNAVILDKHESASWSKKPNFTWKQNTWQNDDYIKIYIYTCMYDKSIKTLLIKMYRIKKYKNFYLQLSYFFCILKKFDF